MIRSVILAPESYSQPFMLVSGPIILGLYAGLGYKIYMGKNWARLLLALGFVAGSLLMLTKSTPQANPAPIPALQWVQGIIQLACVVLLYVKSSREWFLMQKAGGH
jgi:hypothetical protein